MSRKIFNIIIVAGVGSLTLFGAAIASSHSTGNAVVDARMAAMKNLGKNMKAIGAVAKGEAPYSNALNTNAAEVAKIATQISGLFKEKVMVDTDRAKPEIWMQMDDFRIKAKDFEKASDTLVAAVSSGDQGAIGAALGATGKSCGGCHKPYRKPKE